MADSQHFKGTTAVYALQDGDDENSWPGLGVLSRENVMFGQEEMPGTAAWRP
jgi:hypothetical protein